MSVASALVKENDDDGDDFLFYFINLGKERVRNENQ